uniref:Alanine--tRNA ligase n=1 Tax=Zeugodacus cucurbitae TaxID=28588 RepID=A0A0A1XFM3_ZEUCU
MQFKMKAKKKYPVPFLKAVFLFFYVILLSKSEDVIAQPYKQQRCSSRLENALEHMRRRSIPAKSSRSFSGETPYTLYQTFYGQNSEPEDDFYSGGDRGYYAKNIQRQPQSESPAYMGRFDDLFSSDYNRRQPHKLAAVSSVDVEDLRVRLPSKSTSTRWVEVDKCRFSTQNSTLDTRLIFPDLTISGKVVLQPTGGKCHMILRLRRAGIEFRTIPIGFESAVNEESRRIGAASVRTDSHFAEPGFISVFAHGCQGPSGVRLRQNSKRRFGFEGAETATQGTAKPPAVELSEPHVVLGTAATQAQTSGNRWRKYYNPYPYDIRSEKYQKTNRRNYDRNWRANDQSNENIFYDARDNEDLYRAQYREKRESNPFRQRRSKSTWSDEFSFDDDILNVSDDLQDLIAPDARAFADLFSDLRGDRDDFERENVRDRDEAGDAFSSELEKIFSMGVRGLLTTYMQRALQPAIKETLMENMGYTLSYG